MRQRIFLLTFLLTTCGLLASSLSGGLDSTARAEAALPPVERATLSAEILVTLTDNYGYTATSLASSPWLELKDIGTEVEAFSPNSDDGYAYNPATSSYLYPIGFSFLFYEKTYTQLRISTNGYLTMDGTVSEQLIRNLDLPSDQKPNSIIAPFWDDLTKGTSGAMYYARGSLDGQDYFAVQWESFSRFNTTDPVTFQVLLFENGNILFRYNSMNGNLLDASVGIEDGDGVDGISYFYNGTGTPVTSSSAILFTRPGAGWRAKLTPLYSGGFIVAGKAQFDITLANTGNIVPADTSDSYNFTSSLKTASKPGWQVAFLLNGQLVANSGPLQQLASQVYQVIVYPPADAEVGDHALIELKATSTHDPAKSATVSVQVAVPAKFMHAYADSIGMHLGLYWKENVAGSTFAMFDENIALVPAEENYVMAWDRQDGATNLNYVVINKFGIPDAYVSWLEYNNSTTDRFPSLAGGWVANQQVVAVWPRYFIDDQWDKTFELMLAVIDPVQEPSLVKPPTPLIGNTKPYSYAGGGVQIQDASASWVGSDKVWIIWTEQRFLDLVETTTDIRAGLYNLGGYWVDEPLLLAEGTTSVFYSDPTLISIQDGTILAFFSGVNLEQKTQQIYWTALGVEDSGITQLGTLQGSSLDATILGDKVMLTWVTPDRGAVSYNFLSLSGSGSTLSLLPGETQSLVLENHNLVEHVSLFTDQQDNGILTWKNVDSTQMYYALIDRNGELTTPAVMFFRDPSARIKVSKNGQSSTIYIGAYWLKLPRISK